MSVPVMKPLESARLFTRLLAVFGVLALSLATPAAWALKSDRQQPLDVEADHSDGTLGDGRATLSGNVEIRQGTLLIRADVATVEKVDGQVRRFELTGEPVHLQQEIENEGLVTAEARRVDYEVASGIVTLTGRADVDHPQYQISGEVLRYDMNVQHFQGSGGGDDGRIRILLEPEMLPREVAPGAAVEDEPAAEENEPATEEPSGGETTGSAGP